MQEYIRRHTIEQESLKPYLFFSPQHYTRNLIFKNDVFECLAVCWDLGQQSAIHDHNDKSGWFYLAMGRLFIQNYRVEERDPVRRTCRLIPNDGVELSADQAGFVDKEEDVHKVCNLPRFNGRAVSVHIYRQPRPAAMSIPCNPAPMKRSNSHIPANMAPLSRCRNRVMGSEGAQISGIL